MDYLSDNLTTSVGSSFMFHVVNSLSSLPFLSHSYHAIEFDRIIVTLMLTQHKLMTSVSTERNAKRRQMSAFVEMTQNSYFLLIPIPF